MKDIYTMMMILMKSLWYPMMFVVNAVFVCVQIKNCLTFVEISIMQGIAQIAIIIYQINRNAQFVKKICDRIKNNFIF